VGRPRRRSADLPRSPRRRATGRVWRRRSRTAWPIIHSGDPNDDYLIAAAASARATLVTGDAHLLEFKSSILSNSPRALLGSLG
jgi:hypothetical protein